MEKIFRNCKIFSPIDRGSPCSGKRQGDLQAYGRGALVVRDGIITGLGEEEDVLKQVGAREDVLEHDCEGCCLIPGFVDPHTHCCFASLREQEFALRAAGTPYLESLKRGGGILSSVTGVADATEEELAITTRKHVKRALSLGTTTMEIKSGYGLNTELELKMLRVIRSVGETTPVDVVATFLGAHALPPAYAGAPDEFISLLIRESLPAVAAQGIAQHCDIFCEQGVFTIEQGRRLLTAAQNLGFHVKLHADEVHDLGGAGLAAELGAISADHLLAASNENLKAMAREGVIANLLPGTAYSLRKEYARARDMIAMGLPVALATDCNPGSSFTESMQFIIGLAVMNMEMTPEEALIGATLNSAYALGLQKKVGSLEPGKQADFLLLDGETPAILAYHAGVSSVVKVFKKGVEVSGS